MLLRRLLPAATVLCLALPAAAANEKGFLRIEGTQGPSKSATHVGWFDMASSDIEVEATPALQCTVAADILALHVAPMVVGLAGTTVPEVKIELTDFKGQTYYKARLHDVLIRKTVSATENGLHVEGITMEPASIHLEVKKRSNAGFLEPGTQRTITCGPSRM